MICQACGKGNSEDALYCAGCGNLLKDPFEPTGSTAYSSLTTNAGGTTTQATRICVQIPVAQTNGVGTAGFVFALLGLFLAWMPVFGWIIWFLGAALSIAGLFRVPKGLAIAGTIISFIGVIVLAAGISFVLSVVAFTGY